MYSMHEILLSILRKFFLYQTLLSQILQNYGESYKYTLLKMNAYMNKLRRVEPMR